MRKTCVAAVATIMLAGCGSEPSGTFETEDGEEGSYSIDATGGNSEFRMETADGEISANSGTDVPVDLPDGFSLYPGSTVVTNSTVNAGAGSGSMVIMTTQDSPEEIAAYYRDQAEAAGIEIAMAVSGQGSEMLSGEGPDGDSFTVNASTNDEGTTVQLIVGSGMSD